MVRLQMAMAEMILVVHNRLMAKQRQIASIEVQVLMMFHLVFTCPCCVLVSKFTVSSPFFELLCSEGRFKTPS